MLHRKLGHTRPASLLTFLTPHSLWEYINELTAVGVYLLFSKRIVFDNNFTYSAKR